MKTEPQEAQAQFYNQQAGVEKQALDTLHNTVSFQRATAAEQRAMENSAKQEADRYLRQQLNIAPLDYGAPTRYIGVTDRTEEQAIAAAHAKVTAFKSDPRHNPRPTTKETSLASRAIETPQYKKWIASQSQDRRSQANAISNTLGGLTFTPTTR